LALGAVAATSMFLPGGLIRSANAQSVSFDYYIGPKGSDSNPGTLASPWSITAINSKQSIYAGKRVGMLDGYYNIASMMTTNRDVPALMINGGSAISSTVIAAVNARAVQIDAYGNGNYGGGTGNAACAMIGTKSTVSNPNGYITIDGILFTGGCYLGIEMGNYSFTGPTLYGIVIQNCEFTNFNNTAQTTGGNTAQICLNVCSGALLNNNYHHNNVGYTVNSGDHFSALYQWHSSGTVIQYCTLIASGNLHGKEGGNQGTTIRYCYIDTTNLSSGQNVAPIQGFDGATTAGLTQTSYFHHNILLALNGGMDLKAELGNGGWTTPLVVYNNTFISTAGFGGGITFYEQLAGSRLLTFYNNLYYENGHAPSSYGYVNSNSDAFALADYNIYGGHAQWSTAQVGAHDSTGTTYETSLSSWQGATGVDAHSSSAVVVFTSQGTMALQYKITSGIALLAGRVGGTSSGTPCNVGAWDGTSNIIGYAGSPLVTPKQPVLSVS
jgi:hypothetical protein